MANFIALASDELIRKLRETVAALQARGELPAGDPSIAIEVPADPSHGDFASNLAMVSAKIFRMKPREIADRIAGAIDLTDSHFDSCEVAGPGFLNFRLGTRWFSEVVDNVLAEGDRYGRSTVGGGKKMMVEYVSANPTGPMHMGNARGGALGDGIAACYDWAGYDVTREFYVNDAGNQIDKFGRSLEARYLQLYPGEEGVPFPEDGYHGEDIIERARQFAEIHGDSYLDKPEAERRQALIDYALPRNIEGLRRDLARYRIEFDVWFRESSLYQDGEVEQVLQQLADKGLTYEKDGAIWYKASEHGGEKDEVLVRHNGVPTYFAADIAYHYNKFVKRGFEYVIDVWGADHHGHVARMKGAMDALGIGGDKLEVVIMQLVRLTRDGEVVRMSKRTGKAITLNDLIDEIPIDAARFFFNMREPSSHLEFDLGLAVEQSSQNPVYYVQYAHARICSIEKNLAAEGIHPIPRQELHLERLTAPAERALVRHLANLPQEIVLAAHQSDPARITRYTIELATLFHKFYNECRVRGEDAELMQARFALCLATRTALKNALSILKITAPETM